ncbi:MAG: hypothetical protein ACFFCI_13360 [Promethearchaeota archaeon]
MDYQQESELTQNTSINSKTLLSRQVKKVELHLLISICSLIIVLFTHYFIQESLNLFYNTILLVIVFISLLFTILPRLKTIETTLAIGKNVESSIVFKKGMYAGLIVIASLIVLLITSLMIALYIIVLLMFIFLNELKMVYKEGKLQQVFQKTPVILLSIFIILIAVGFYEQKILDFLTFLIEISITFIFTIFLFDSFSEIKAPKEHSRDENEVLKKKVKEIFDKKTCVIHPSQIPNMSCFKCNRHICELCKTNYMDFCIYCYKQKIEDRLLLFQFITYLSIALFTIFLISFIWGMFAPLPLILRFIEWLGLYYRRFTILFYYATANLIILITLGGGSLFASRQLKIKINLLENSIKQASD